MSDAASSIALVHHAASLSPEGPLPVAGGVTSAAAPPDGVPVAMGAGTFVTAGCGVFVGAATVACGVPVVVATGVFVGVRVAVRVGVFAGGVFVGCAAACTVIVPAMPPPDGVPWSAQ